MAISKVVRNLVNICGLTGFKVKRFIEKPDEMRARAFFEKDCYELEFRNVH